MNKRVTIKQQQQIVNELYEKLINQEKKIILLQGDYGTGKSSCIEMIVEKLIEGWSLHIIDNPDLPIIPNASLKLSHAEKIRISPSIDFNIIKLNMELNFNESKEIFSDAQKIFYDKIANSITNKALIIVEDYDKLDKDLVRFVNTIIYFSREKHNIHFLISGEKIDSLFNNDNKYILKTESLNSTDFKNFISCYKQLSDNDIKRIYKITNGNLSFAKNLINNNESDEDEIEKIISKRIFKHLQNDVSLFDTAKEILTIGSFFKKGFTQSQIWDLFVLEDKQHILPKIFIKLDKVNIPLIFKSLNNIKILDRYDGNKYDFSLVEFKNYFYKFGQDLRENYFFNLYDYFSRNYDYDYEIRTYYLNEYLKINKSPSDKHVALFFLLVSEDIYSNTIQAIENIKKYPICDKFDKDIIDKLIELFNIMIDIQTNYSTENMSTILKKLNKINFDNPIIDSEIIRLKIEIISKTTRSTIQMENQINELLSFYDILIDKEEYFEFAHWIRVSSTLISHITNRANLNEKLNPLILNLSKVLEIYRLTNKDFALYYKNILNRKSALYLHPELVENKIYNAINYFNGKNIYELYKCYVNFLGTQVILGNLEDAKETVINLHKLLHDNKTLTFPQKRKMENNELLYKYFKSKNEQINNNIIIEFEHLSNKYPESNIIKMNYISMLLSKGNKIGIDMLATFIRKNAEEFNDDNFYQFYLNDLKLVYEICCQDWNNANKTFLTLQKITPPKFYNEYYYCTQRVEAFRIILYEELEYDYNSFKNGIYDLLATRTNFRGKDSAWKFFSQGFILSDYQFFV